MECCFYPRFKGIFLQDQYCKCDVEGNNFSVLWTCQWDVVPPAPMEQQALCCSHSWGCTAGTGVKGIPEVGRYLVFGLEKEWKRTFVTWIQFCEFSFRFWLNLGRFSALPGIMCSSGRTWHWLMFFAFNSKRVWLFTYISTGYKLI